MKKRSIAIIICIATALVFLPAFLPGEHFKAFAKTNKVHLENAESYDISNAKKNTIIYIDDDTCTGSGNRGIVELKGSSKNVWVHIAVSSGHTVFVDLADGLTIKPGKNSAKGTGKRLDTLGNSRAGIYIDETKSAGGIVVLRSEQNAKITIDSYKSWPYLAVPAIMKNDTKTKLVFDTVDKSAPGTIIAKPTDGSVNAGAAGIGAFGHGVLGIATSRYTVGNIEFTGGNIEAYGHDDGPGIGAYEYSNVGELIFNGAHVKAMAGNKRYSYTMTGAAGIGVCYRGNIDKISIFSGYVEAWGLGSMKDSLNWPLSRILDTSGSGIGGGWYNSHTGEILIAGGTVRAYGGTCAEIDGYFISGCGIGPDVQIGSDHATATADKITITGGDIKATGGDYTCGIGGCVGEILIAPATPDTELKIEAGIDTRASRNGKKHALGAGIGISNNAYDGDYSKCPGNITIKGGDITAVAGNIGDSFDKQLYCGAGIGPTSHGKVTSITITGGKINAVGGWNSPGIGGPNGCADTYFQTVENIHISGGTITATKATKNGKNVALSGIGGYKKGKKSEGTDIRITGGNVISEGTDFAIGYDTKGQPMNDAGEIVSGTKFKFDPDVEEWTRVDSFALNPELKYDYGLNDVYAKKGLGDESDDNMLEFWIPVSENSLKYTCTEEISGKKYGAFDTSTLKPAKIEAGDTTTLKTYTDITYVNKMTGDKYSGFGIYGADSLSIDPAPSAIPRYDLIGYMDEAGKKVADGGYGDTKLPLLQSMAYVDTNGKWKAKDTDLTLYMMLWQTEYIVSYDKNKPGSASHSVEGEMADSTFSVEVASQLSKNAYSLAGWSFQGWNTKPDGTGIAYSDQDLISFKNWDRVTLYAQWKPKTYTITFQSGDAGIEPDHQQKDLEYDTKYTLDTIADIGWTYDSKVFHGWTDRNLGSFHKDGQEFCNLCSMDYDTGDPAGKTLTAEWVGSGSIRVTASVDGKYTDVTDNMVIASSGDVFKKTLTDQGDGNYEASLEGLPEDDYHLAMQSDTYVIPLEYQDLGQLTENSAVSVILDYYTVHIEKDPGQTDMIESVMISGSGFLVPDRENTRGSYKGDTLTIQTALNPGYHFDGYSVSGIEPEWENDRSVANQGMIVQGKADIMAHAEADVYSVEFDQNKPQNASHDVKGSMEEQDFVFNEEQKLWENGYALTGWTFTGWNSEADGSGVDFSDEYLMDKDAWQSLGYPENRSKVTLYAQWQPNEYIVYFSATSATSGQMDPEVFTYDTPQTLTANAFERTDWHFIGWNTEPAGSGTAFEDGQEIYNLTTGKSVTLYAQWEHDYYTVKYDKNSDAAIGEMPEEHVWTNSAYELPLCDYHRPGYTPESWNTKPDGSGTRYENGDILENAVPKGASMTLYVQWAPNSYTVKFDANEGKGKMKDQSFVYDVAQDLEANGFRRDHYVFTGWNVVPDGSGESFADRESVMNLTADFGGTVTLYAQWEKEEHTISYDLNGGTLNGETGIVEAKCHYGDEIELPEPSREGYTFDYWKGSRYKAGDSYTVSDDHVFTAQWKKNNKNGPYTGDDNSLTGALLMMAAALSALLVMIIIRIRSVKNCSGR